MLTNEPYCKVLPLFFFIWRKAQPFVFIVSIHKK